MRPNIDTSRLELYECFDCGARVKAPETAVCGDCGGTLRNISRGRDL